MRTNTPITIFNKSVLRGVERFYRHVIPAAAWQNTKGITVQRTGNTQADTATIHIPFYYSTDYLAPHDWEKLTDKAKKFTLKANDYIVKGEVTKELGSGYSVEDLRREFGDVLRVKTVELFDLGSEQMHHWRIGAV